MDISSTDQLEDLLSQPTEAAIGALEQTDGDITLLGVAGKMGPTLARMALRAAEASGQSRRIIGVSRFSQPETAQRLQSWGIETVTGDLLDPAFVAALPTTPNVISMTGLKFGATGQESLTWAMNVHLPSLICQHFRNSRIVAFSSGNVYGLVPTEGNGSQEDDTLHPVGEYAMSCLGRERMYQYFSQTLNVPTALLRLNYASELRYGVLVDLARQVWEGTPIDISMGYVNVIWQGDANAMALAALANVAVPAQVINIAGPEKLSLREVCQQFGQRMGKPVTFSGVEADTALLNNGTSTHTRYGPPRVSALQMIDWITDWIQRGGESLDKPTHFQNREGRF
jgi:nucleoside-diphosphate-sugar epimerase